MPNFWITLFIPAILGAIAMYFAKDTLNGFFASVKRLYLDTLADKYK